MGKSREMRLAHLCCCCCLLYQLGVLSNGIVSGLQFAPDREEWEVVFPALWRREPVDPARGSGVSADPGWVRGSRTPAASSSREVRSVAPAPPEEPVEGLSEPRPPPLPPPPPPPPQEGEEDEEFESQELPRGSGGTASVSPGAPASWQPPPPPRPPPSPPPALHAEPEGDEVLLRIPAFSRDLYLLLRRDGRFLAPRFEVEQRPSPGQGPTRAAATPGPPAPPDAACFYTGAVLRHPGSLASFSTCGGGLMGFIQLNEDFIFIEPLNDTMAITGHPHRVYRQKRSMGERVTEKPTPHSQYCGVLSDKGRPRSKKITESGRGKRYSYKLPQEYNIETVVVADPAVVSHHGADAARRFILTILNMVFNLFQHKSLGVQVSLRVIKLVLLHEMPADLYIGHHGEKMLESFCKWQHEEFGKKNDIHLEMSTSWGEDAASVDAAILITRKDFCVHKDEPCDTVGIAYLSGMCSEKRKCIIAEDNGLNLAFTIAHEMGHNMGISHDNDHPSCADGLHIMSGEWIKGQNLGDVSWSQCSKEDLERFLRSKASNCLLQTNPQSVNSVMVPSKLPGMTYTADEQCQILFGPLASFCQEMQACGARWKARRNAEPNWTPRWTGPTVTLERHDFWNSGVRLASVPAGPPHLDTWRESGACGAPAAAPAAPGPAAESASVPGLPGFRDWQCQASGVRASSSKHVLQWQAVTDEEKPCALFCSPVGKEEPILLSEKVMDGTSCGYQGLDFCANGRCQKVGCDGVLGSLAREDHCGVCNGNGKSCRVVKGEFNHTRGTGYVEVLVIPTGARRIKVVEEKPAHSYLALRDAGKQSINSDWKIEHSGAFSLAGTTVHYVRRGLWEKISARGPTTSPLHLLVLLFQDQTYGLHYEYTIPSDPPAENQSAKAPEPLFLWTHTGWEDCDATCGGGERKTTVSCTKIMNKNISIVDNKKCRHLTKPEPQIRKCNEQPCQTRWMMTEWTPCSRTCGKGMQSRQVACTQQLSNGTLTRARERDCAGPKPAAVQRCEGQDCMTVWEAGVWSECSVKCGKGVRHRTVRCTNPRKKCVLSTRPREAEDCEDYSKCYVWRMGDWSKCSITCGKGMQSRVIQCMHKITGRHGNECFSSEKPAAYRPCHLQPCNEKINVNTITSPRLAALTFKCLGDQWPVYCRVIREKNLCQDMRWYQRCCETCRDFYAQKLQQKS
ncbi:A disintegrin and metalloproteinase with thrombospondin motifs 19 isoform X2 [Phyllostomus discolor]|uniref:A disintegrin and metalloproteinase with thrombospondin motifs 19 isoform X2 n=1 Tax=Phyllostomus discolor TaxID=89673 RepID=A0A7E6CUU5_9CHIR|nr:A disintegrin and metalloproteinase with thrombospondin motifs 19 isoform X2 [Phyllostomus discolor]